MVLDCHPSASQVEDIAELSRFHLACICGGADYSHEFQKRC